MVRKQLRTKSYTFTGGIFCHFHKKRMLFDFFHLDTAFNSRAVCNSGFFVQADLTGAG